MDDDIVDIDDVRFSENFWRLFFDTIKQMTDQGFLDTSVQDAESADLFFATLAARMIDLADGPMPPLDETIAVIQHVMRNEIKEIEIVLRQIEAAGDN